MADETTSPELGLEGGSELSRQGICQGHPGSAKVNIGAAFQRLTRCAFLFLELVYLSSFARARAESALAKDLQARARYTKRYTGELNLTASDAEECTYLC